jgi:hypothetical protein
MKKFVFEPSFTTENGSWPLSDSIVYDILYLVTLFLVYTLIYVVCKKWVLSRFESQSSGKRI